MRESGVRVPAWSMAVVAMLLIQVSNALSVGVIEHVRRAFGMRGDGGVGVLCLELQQLGLAERLVHDAHARPEQHFAVEFAG